MVAKDRLLNGLHKLNETNKLVDGMKEQLASLAPVLEAKSKSTAELLVKVGLELVIDQSRPMSFLVQWMIGTSVCLLDSHDICTSSQTKSVCTLQFYWSA